MKLVPSLLAGQAAGLVNRVLFDAPDWAGYSLAVVVALVLVTERREPR